MYSIILLAKTVNEGGDEDVFGPYNVIQDYLTITTVLHKHLDKELDIPVSICVGALNGEYIVNILDEYSKDECIELIEAINEPVVPQFNYSFLENHHLKFDIIKP